MDKLKQQIVDKGFLSVASRTVDVLNFFGINTHGGKAVINMLESYVKDESFLSDISSVVDALDFTPEASLNSQDPPVWGPGLVEPPGGQNYANRYYRCRFPLGPELSSKGPFTYQGSASHACSYRVATSGPNRTKM